MSEDNVTFSLKVMVNKEKTKVLFAEADSTFVSVLLSFLLLPLGRIAKLLEQHYPDDSPVFGSITSLYKSLANLDDAHFSKKTVKRMLLDPPSSFDSEFRELELYVFKDSPIKYFVCCAIPSCERNSIRTYYSDFAFCNCGLPLNKEVVAEDCKGYRFTIKTASFVISDDLKMVPNSAGFFQTLSNLGITVADGAELRNLNLGTIEVMDLLKCCLLSKTPLTDFILNNGGTISSAATPRQTEFLLHQIANEEPAENGKKITLKVMLHKSTNKVLFAQANQDFIELLFSFLVIPVSGVESLLDTNTCLNSLDNLHRSISDVTMDKYFISQDTKTSLMNPNIPDCYKSRNPFFPLNYKSPTTLERYIVTSHTQPRLIYQFFSNSLFTFKSPEGEGNYVKEPTTYSVTDDLTVTPFHFSSAFSILNSLNISLSDVEEREVNIRMQEALSILKASLTSTSALTNGLMNSLMKKQPKQEH